MAGTFVLDIMAKLASGILLIVVYMFFRLKKLANLFLFLYNVFAEVVNF